MRALASISQSALAHNISLVKQYSQGAKVVAMVKSNAYGHHFDLISPLIQEADLLAVSELSEARKLRQYTQQPILLLSGVYSQTELHEAINLNCRIVVHELAQLAIVLNTKSNIKVWLQIETGMHRLGLFEQDFAKVVEKIQQHPNIYIETVMSHFACADKPDDPHNQQQYDKFNRIVKSHWKKSMANSAAILSNPSSVFDFVRPGIMLYGASPFHEKHSELKPVMKLSAPIISINKVTKGESIGYGATWVADKDSKIAVVGIGYGDGYPRHAPSGTPVLINQRLCSLVGRVSMDLITVDVSGVETQLGDEAILWGVDKLPAEVVAKYANTISYELFTGVSNRVNFKLV